VEQFAAPSSIGTLTHLIQQVLLSPGLPLHLGHQALQFLLHQFLCCSLSVYQFSRTLQMSMLEHFHWQPLSFLIGKWDDLDSVVGTLNNNQCEMIRATPSFRKYVDGLTDPAEQIRLLTEDKPLKEVAVEQLQRLMEHQQTFPPLLLSLHTLTENLPTAPLGRKLHDVFLMCMERHIVEHNKFNTAWNLVKMMGREALTAAVEKSITILNTSLNTSQDKDNSLLLQTLQVLRRFLAELERIDKDAQQAAGEREGEVESTPRELLTTSERKMMFQERLRQVASRKREPSAFEKARTTLLEGLLPCFQEGLIPPQMLPLHEVCYFNNSSSLRKHLSPAPRASLHIALTKPTFYLPSATSVSEHSRLSPNMPDVCIVYQLHLECGRLINLFDWLCSFVSVVDPAAAEKLTNQERGKGRKEDIDPTLQYL
jgi:origin recognition complex subunit 3